MLYAGLPIGAIGSSVLNAFWLSNPAGKAIVIIHFFGSILAWSVMITKWRELNQAQRLSSRFHTAYRKEPYPVSLFLKRLRFDGSPVFAVYEGICRALVTLIESHGGDTEDLFVGDAGTPKRRLKESEINALRTLGEGALAAQAFRLENGMSMLAIAVSAAPTLGLLGTVWGVMEAFGAMTSSGSAMLSAVAPGISGALLTTVTGLLVALPSAVVYNMLTDRIRALCLSTENFLQSLLADVESHYRQQD